MADVAQVATQSTDFKSIRLTGQPEFSARHRLRLAGAMAPAMGLTDVFCPGLGVGVRVVSCSSHLRRSHRRLRTLGSDRRKLADHNAALLGAQSFGPGPTLRMDVGRTQGSVVGRSRDSSYYTPAGEINIEREDRDFNPELARLIIDKAG
ncbi:MAG: hypothetical protein R2838_20440 [Caldilineaceae bacterium]